MIERLPRNIFRFALLVLLQIFVFNNIQINGYLNPYFYVLFILLVPFEVPAWIVLFVSFALGISIDIFSDTMGMHTTATVFMGFLRPYILSVISPRDGYEPGTYPRVLYYGLPWFANYTLVLVFAHHLLLFYIEVFKFAHFFDTLLRVVLSTLFTTFFILISQYLVFRK